MSTEVQSIASRTIDQEATRVGEEFAQIFGRSSLKERIEDIDRETGELRRYVDVPNLRTETGDLLASVLALCHENGWKPSELLRENSAKIQRRRAQYRSLGRKTKVAVFGGAFDPVTLGHIQVAKLVLDTSREFDEVWIMPAFRHLSGKAMSPMAHRLEMCRLAARVDARIKVSDFEAANSLGGDTYQMVKLLLEEKQWADSHHFSIVVGQDNANTMHTWPNHEHLERAIRHVVVPRPGVTASAVGLWYSHAPHIYLVPEVGSLPLDTSSTRARAILAQTALQPSVGDLSKLLDPAVENYAREYKLYTMPVTSKKKKK